MRSLTLPENPEGRCTQCTKPVDVRQVAYSFQLPQRFRLFRTDRRLPTDERLHAFDMPILLLSMSLKVFHAVFPQGVAVKLDAEPRLRWQDQFSVDDPEVFKQQLAPQGDSASSIGMNSM